MFESLNPWNKKFYKKISDTAISNIIFWQRGKVKCQDAYPGESDWQALQFIIKAVVEEAKEKYKDWPIHA